MITRTVLPSSGSPRASRRSRKPRVAVATTTSLSVPPSARRTRLTSSSGYDVHVYRRLGPIRPLSVDALPPRAARRPSARPATAVSAAATGPRTAETAPRATCTGLRAMLPAASHASSSGVGGGAGVQASGGRLRGRRALSSMIEIMSAPATPSTIAW